MLSAETKKAALPGRPSSKLGEISLPGGLDLASVIVAFA
jgi:hypothetical protein